MWNFRKYCRGLTLLVVGLAILPAYAGSCDPLALCATQQIPLYDDGITPAWSVARAIADGDCIKETGMCVSEFKEQAFQDALDKVKADGIYQKYPNIEKVLRRDFDSPETGRDIEDEVVNHLLTPQVLKHRVKIAE